MDSKFKLSGYAEKIFKLRYAYTEEETFDQACKRVSKQVSKTESIEKQSSIEESFYNILSSNLFMPGGRIWYGSGRVKPNLLNCFVVDTEDSREGWGKLVSESIVISALGGGIGIPFTNIRPKGDLIRGIGGVASGSVSLMRIVNAAAEEIRSGGSRRAALMMALPYNHPDIQNFLDAKLDLNQLNNANISVIIDNEFIDKVEQNKDVELTFAGKTYGKIKAKKLFDRIIDNSVNNGEPGILNLGYANEMNNIYYSRDLICTNPCFHGDTFITTRRGTKRIKNLVGETVDIWNGTNWQTIDNFRVTGTNEQVLVITLLDGSELKVTPDHIMELDTGHKVKAKELVLGSVLKKGNTIQHGSIQGKGAYFKGFLTGYSVIAFVEDETEVYLYPKTHKYEGRLKESYKELGLNNELKTKESTFKDNILLKIPTDTERFSWFREIPEYVFSWSLLSRLEFIQGVIDACGSFTITPYGGGYEIYYNNKKWLSDFQILLKTVGAPSLLRELKVKGDTLTYKLIINKPNVSMVSNKKIVCTRLREYHKKTKEFRLGDYNHTIIGIREGGIEEKVYCCTVEGSHSLSLGVGVQTGQCGELPLSKYQSCCLGSIVLPNFVTPKGEFEYDKLEGVIPTIIRFLDNVLDINHYPLQQIEVETKKFRRLGIGVLGIHDMLLKMGLKYSSPQGRKQVEKVLEVIKKTSYEASTYLAVEKGSFPKLDKKQYIEGNFIKTLPKWLVNKISQYGIRNSALLTIAPTGSTGIVCGCSGGVEPLFSYAYKRSWVDNSEKTQSEIVIHPLFESFIKQNKDVSHFESSHEISVEDHIKMQHTCQKYIDGSISKTINIPSDYSSEDIKSLVLKYIRELKGITIYRDGSRGVSPLTPLSIEEARSYIEKEHITASTENKCSGGKCSL